MFVNFRGTGTSNLSPTRISGPFLWMPVVIVTQHKMRHQPPAWSTKHDLIDLIHTKSLFRQSNIAAVGKNPALVGG